MRKLFRIARPCTAVLAGVLLFLLVLSLIAFVKVTLPRGVQIWLRAGEIGYVVPSGRYAEIAAGLNGFGFSGQVEPSFADWSPTAIRPSRSGSWVQSFLWFPLLPPALLGSAMAVTLHLLLRPPAQGRCASCGYCRSGLPQAAPCPECGQTPA